MVKVKQHSVLVVLLLVGLLFQWGCVRAEPDRAFTNSLGMKMVCIGQSHQVAEGFWAAECETKQSDYERVMGENPSHYRGPNRPVESITQAAALEFCHRLTKLDAKAGLLPSGYEYTLPTIEQWKVCNYGISFEKGVSRLRDAKKYGPVTDETQDVGTSPDVTVLGLRDVAGNVSEWSKDTIGGGSRRDCIRRPYILGFEIGPLMGGSFSDEYRVGSAHEYNFVYPTTGFRCYLSPVRREVFDKYPNASYLYRLKDPEQMVDSTWGPLLQDETSYYHRFEPLYSVLLNLLIVNEGSARQRASAAFIRFAKQLSDIPEDQSIGPSASGRLCYMSEVLGPMYSDVAYLAYWRQDIPELKELLYAIRPSSDRPTYLKLWQESESYLQEYLNPLKPKNTKK